MMARSKCSNQRPDTLMQDRSPPARRNHLQRTVGPYIRVNRARLTCRQSLPVFPDSGHPFLLIRLSTTRSRLRMNGRFAPEPAGHEFSFGLVQIAANWSNLAWPRSARSAQEQRYGIGQRMVFVLGRELDHQSQRTKDPHDRAIEHDALHRHGPQLHGSELALRL
jgi:hypothetical protein